MSDKKEAVVDTLAILLGTALLFLLVREWHESSRELKAKALRP
jgi:hypothetical protein